jgi:hypothetical protein
MINFVLPIFVAILFALNHTAILFISWLALAIRFSRLSSESKPTYVFMWGRMYVFGDVCMCVGVYVGVCVGCMYICV